MSAKVATQSRTPLSASTTESQAGVEVNRPRSTASLTARARSEPWTKRRRA